MQSLPGFPIPMPNESIAGRMLTDKRWKSLRPAGMKRSGIPVRCIKLLGAATIFSQLHEVL